MAMTAVTTNTFTWGDPNNIGVIAQPVGVAPWNNITQCDHHIQGKLVQHQVVYSNTLFEDRMVNADAIKKELVRGLAEKIMQENCIEFTMQEDHSMGTKICRARIFAVPDTQVRILREKKVI